ncbi:MAG: restriction endonuclease [Alphaproteobacteria bacterium]|nr:restriction endonuclease [Alphaproteobacteria bacterium]
MHDKKVRDGKYFHMLVESIERAIHHDPNATIESPKRLRDIDTGRLREHDVVITFRQNHHEIRVALECRDRSRAVGVPDVEAFSKKCEKTSIHKGVIVSAKGFRKTALEKAKILNIDCLQLKEAEKFDWCAMPGVIQVCRRIRGMKLKVITKDVPPNTIFTLFENPNTEITKKELMNIGINLLNNIPPEEILPEEGSYFIKDVSPNFHFVTSDGIRFVPKELRIEIEYRTEIKMLPLQFLSYDNEESGEEGYSIATTEFKHEALRGKIIFVKKGSELRCSFVPEPLEVLEKPCENQNYARPRRTAPRRRGKH